MLAINAISPIALLFFSVASIIAASPQGRASEACPDDRTSLLQVDSVLQKRGSVATTPAANKQEAVKTLIDTVTAHINDKSLQTWVRDHETKLEEALSKDIPGNSRATIASYTVVQNVLVAVLKKPAMQKWLTKNAATVKNIATEILDNANVTQLIDIDEDVTDDVQVVVDRHAPTSIEKPLVKSVTVAVKHEKPQEWLYRNAEQFKKLVKEAFSAEHLQFGKDGAFINAMEHLTDVVFRSSGMQKLLLAHASELQDALSAMSGFDGSVA